MLLPTRYPGVYVSPMSENPEHGNAYKESANQALDKINSGRTGHQLLDDLAHLAKKGRRVTLVEVNASQTPGAAAVLTSPQREKYPSFDYQTNEYQAEKLSKPKKFLKVFNKKSEGASAEVYWNPIHTSINLTENGSPDGYSDDARDGVSVLGHEMIHAKNILKGTYLYEQSSTSSYAVDEEHRAVGIGKYKYSKTGEPSENSIRAEHNLPLRKRY